MDGADGRQALASEGGRERQNVVTNRLSETERGQRVKLRISK